MESYARHNLTLKHPLLGSRAPIHLRPIWTLDVTLWKQPWWSQAYGKEEAKLQPTCYSSFLKSQIRVHIYLQDLAQLCVDLAELPRPGQLVKGAFGRCPLQNLCSLGPQCNLLRQTVSIQCRCEHPSKVLSPQSSQCILSFAASINSFQNPLETW